MEKNQLRKALIDQKQEIESLPSRMKIVKRACFEKYKEYMPSNHIKVIMGVRRCGKSMLSYQLLQGTSFAYVNFDDEKLSNLTAQELNDVIEAAYEIYGNFTHILFDELQNIKGWELFVNRLQRQGLNIIVTGSNANLLSRELSTHLTGRHIPLVLFPFSFQEFIAYHSIDITNRELFSTEQRGLLKKQLEEYIASGGFPDVVRDPVNRNIYMQSLYGDILYKDIISRYKIRFPQTLKQIATSLMSNTASQVSYNKIKNIFALKSAHTAQDYLSFLEESFLFLLVPRFSYKPKQRAIANRKIYAIDTGMIRSLSVEFSPNTGKLYETIVFLELMRRRSEIQSEIYYWQDISQCEVDFVVKEGSGITELIQVCYSFGDYDTKKREVNALCKASEALGCSRLIVITDDYEGQEDIAGKTIIFIPLWKWLLGK